MDAASFVRRVDKLPSLPTLYYELAKAVDNPGIAISAVSEIVRRDQSVTTRLLKLANSAFYSFPFQVETIEEALQLIGLREMRDLALATCVIGAFKNLPSHLVNVTDFWRHSIACGVLSSTLAERRHEPAPERFFVGGLLHDIGRLVLYVASPQGAEEILKRCETGEMPCCKVENLLLGFDHADIGAELLSCWRIPSGLAAMVQHHHELQPGAPGFTEQAIVHCADFITTAMEFGSSGERFVSPISEEAARLCLPDTELLPRFIEQAELRWEQMTSILSNESAA